AVDWTEMAREIRARKFGRARPADFKDKARQMRFLQYRGFESEQIQAAMGDSDE
ncbi:MAG: RecX family transcriptional regulator, partial [Gammaproteobacteria bacterium]|nr:RecX family transcriptional regulator [Gammaproteobacteria bacterium]